jgi:hypothetical protein
LVPGPILRYVSDAEAIVWAETDDACEVEVLDHLAHTFGVEGHRYAPVCVAVGPNRGRPATLRLEEREASLTISKTVHDPEARGPRLETAFEGRIA